MNPVSAEGFSEQEMTGKLNIELHWLWAGLFTGEGYGTGVLRKSTVRNGSGPYHTVHMDQLKATRMFYTDFYGTVPYDEKRYGTRF